MKGDPEAAPIYVKRLVPVFANTFQGSLIPSVKKATLSILKKMIHFIPASMMDEVASGSVASQLVDVLAVALNVEVWTEVLYILYCIIIQFIQYSGVVGGGKYKKKWFYIFTLHEILFNRLQICFFLGRRYFLKHIPRRKSNQKA